MLQATVKLHSTADPSIVALPSTSPRPTLWPVMNYVLRDAEAAMAIKARTFKGVYEAGTEDNGETAQFRIVTEDGASLDIRFTPEQLTDFITDLTNFAARVAAVRTRGKPTFPPETNKPTVMRAIDPTGIALATASDSRSLFLVFRFFDFALNYRIPADQLAPLSDSMSRMAKTLSARKRG